MVVTESLSRKVAISILCVASLGLALYGCGVNTTSTSTPNGFACNPQATDVATFASQVYSSLNANGCLTCHGNKSPLPAPFTGNRFRLNTDPAATIAEQTEDLCICYQFGQLSPGQTLVNHPQDPRHDGTYFNGGSPWSPVQLAPIISWVNNYRLPVAQGN